MQDMYSSCTALTMKATIDGLVVYASTRENIFTSWTAAAGATVRIYSSR